ncbi:MAG: metallophosphoesterase [Alphaproteobacteria bacterium]|nr:metallophosphoesterase [Alphaproteobacteria bacterium]
MRIAHCTDIHWTTDVPWGRLPGKRMLGTANQYLRGRRHHFPREVQQALVRHLMELAPDVVVITGDLTAQALPEEFELAREDLAPVLEAFETLVMPGNHDVYTRGALANDRIAETFGPFMHREGPIGQYVKGDVAFFMLDPNRPTFLDACGEVPSKQLEALRAALDDPSLASKTVVLALHYPILDRLGEVYDDKWHGLLNARELIGLLKAVRFPPALVLHGHEHHGYKVELDLGGGRTSLVVDCGSSGYAHMPKKARAAAMALYDVQDGAITIERYLHDGTRFVPEPGGAFATGR